MELELSSLHITLGHVKCKSKIIFYLHVTVMTFSDFAFSIEFQNYRNIFGAMFLLSTLVFFSCCTLCLRKFNLSVKNSAIHHTYVTKLFQSITTANFTHT